MKNGSGRRAPAAAEKPASDKVIRCAIYTRKSTEEGLQQDFSSLDAQREAGEAFVASQRNEGWQLVPERFDDGGFTGGNMDRPALQRLLTAIEAGRVNCVVVYKVDRLSRSLMDFARMMELFDRCGASFVSVTQQFNTINSLGRLTVNILLSFAQFERELISERTRDKMCAARKKGKWIGGHPVLGYDIDTKARRLIVNRDEAHQVRTIFDQYLETGAMLAGPAGSGPAWLADETVDNRSRPDAGRQALHQESAVWDAHERHLHRPGESQGHALSRRARGDHRTRHVGTGAGHAGPQRSHERSRGQKQVWGPPSGPPFLRAVRHRDGPHVFCEGQQALPLLRMLQGPAARLENCKTKSVAAQAVENAVLEAIRRLGSDQQLAAEVVRQAREQLAHLREEHGKDVAVADAELRHLNAEVTKIAGDAMINATARVDRLLDLQGQIQAAEHRLADLITEGRELDADQLDDADAVCALAEFNPVWASMTTHDQTRLVQLLIAKVGYDGRNGKVTVDFRSAGIKDLCDGTTMNV